MPTVVITQIVCDRCESEDAGHYGPITINSSIPKFIDLCETCYSEVLAPVVSLLDQHGISLAQLKAQSKRPTITGVRRQAGPYLCEFCRAMAKTKRSLIQHLTLSHETTFDEYVEKFGELKALTDEEVANYELTVECTECDKVYSTKDDVKYPHTSMAHHMKREHGLIYQFGAR